MSPPTPRFVYRRVLIASVCAIGLITGLALILSQGRAGSGLINGLFISASFIVLFLGLHGITRLAQRTLGSSYRPDRSHTRKDDSGT